jgi:hypothetical protein
MVKNSNKFFLIERTEDFINDLEEILSDGPNENELIPSSREMFQLGKKHRSDDCNGENYIPFNLFSELN